MSSKKLPIIRNTTATVHGIGNTEIRFATQCAIKLWDTIDENIEAGFVLVSLDDDKSGNTMTVWVAFDSVPESVNALGININGIKSRTGGGMLNMCISNAKGNLSCRVRPAPTQ